MKLIQRYWSRVFATPSEPAVLFIEKSTGEKRHLNWRQQGLATAAIMSFLRANGIEKGDRVAILGWNSAEWVWADFAIQSIGAVTVPVYPNSSAEAAAYVLADAGVKLTLSGDKEQLKKVSVGKAFHYNDVVASLDDVLTIAPSLFAAVLFAEDLLSRLPVIANEIEQLRAGKGFFAEVSADDLATFIYTSGSSGAPKGCMITHGNYAAKMESMEKVGLGMTGDDVVLSYLPLSHVLERVDGMGMCIWNGVPVAFSSVEEMAKNMPVFAPTILCGVPAVWEKIYNGVFNPKDGVLALADKIGLWKPFLNFGLKAAPGSFAGRFFDKKIFAKIRSRMGGRLRLAVSGGAPIPPHVLAFFNRLGIEIIEGYGATETLGGIVTNRPSWSNGDGPKNKVGSVGYVTPGCEVRIISEPGEEDMGVGEIHLAGHQVFKGYWNLAEATAEAFSSDGWFKTGDLGKLDSDGFLYITGRKNGMYKTSGGKYVSREKVEQSLKDFPIVQYSVPVAHGKKYVVALIFVNQAEAATLCGAVPAGVDAAAFYAANEAVNSAVAAAVASANKKLERWEQMKKFVILPIAATIDNGIITETLKIRSKVLIKRFEKEIEALYAETN